MLFLLDQSRSLLPVLAYTDRRFIFVILFDVFLSNVFVVILDVVLTFVKTMNTYAVFKVQI